MRSIAFKLSVPFDNVIEKKYDVVAKQPYIPASGKLSFIVAPLYTNPNYPDMLTYAAFINSAESKSYIKSQLSYFDDTVTATISKYTLYTPFFVKVLSTYQTPELQKETASSLSFTVMLNNYGKVFGIAVQRVENATTSIPSPYQIWQGYDSVNNAVSNATVEVLQPNINYTLTFTLLKAATTYDIYITAGSNHPQFPDLLSGGATVSMEADTKESTLGDETTGAKLLAISFLTLITILAACL